MKRHLIFGLFSLFFATGLHAETLRLAVTTTFRNAGLADVLLPAIKADLGIKIDLIVVGTGQAVGLGRAGDVDAIIVHEPSAEIALVRQGHALHRRPFMYNEFVLLGPSKDPAQVANSKTILDAFTAIATTRSTFISRGDDSGTHIRELTIWNTLGMVESARPVTWYKAVGAGMGTALNIASGLNGYVLSDKASWLTFLNKGQLLMLFSGDPLLFNQYSYLPIAQEKHPHIRQDLALQLEEWLLSDTARNLINSYRLNGETLFTFNGDQ